MAAPQRFALIPAAGTGTRFGESVPKQYAPIAGVPLLKRAIDSLHGAVVLPIVFVVLARDDKFYAEKIGSIPGVAPVYCGGATRAESVRNGLAAVGEYAQAEDWVLVHDAARPCLDLATLHRLLHELEDEPVGGLLAIPLADTLKSGDENQRVAATIPRLNLWRAQTPQMFRYAILQHALRKADVTAITDEAQAIEALGVKPRLIQGSPLNIKVTYPEDVALAEAILGARQPRA